MEFLRFLFFLCSGIVGTGIYALFMSRFMPWLWKYLMEPRP